MKKCYCCGADVPDQSKFCPKCGKPMAVTRDLIDRAKANDPDAQAELYERTYKTVYSRIRAKVPDADTVMDIMQETYLRAFNSLDQLQKAETFPSWILTIANRQVCDWYKKNGKEQQNVQMSELEYESDDTISDEDDLLEMPEYREDFSPNESLDRAETGRLLSEILDTLPEDQRIILTMRYYDEMSLQEISEDLGVNLSTVKSRLTAGKKKVEAKVLELEKSGTKLYSLGPIAFLVYLLHHAELFAPAISANTVIGLAAAGAAGAGAGGAAAVHVTAGAAAKTAVAAAAKGISVKVVAIVAAAVIVVGGGTTATVVAVNNAREASDTASADTSNTESAGSSQEVVVGLTPEEMPAEEDEAEPEPSEEHEETDDAEEAQENDTGTPEENTEQQEPEPSVSEEIQEAPVVLPSEDDVMNILDVFLYWGEDAAYNSGQIYLNTNQAVEIASVIAFWAGRAGNSQEGFESYSNSDDYLTNIFIIPAATVQSYMSVLFGSQFSLADFSNTETRSTFESSIPGFNSSLTEYVLRNANGDFELCLYNGDNAGQSGPNISVESITPNGDNACLAVIALNYASWRNQISLGLVEDSSAEYGWAITSVTLN